MKLVFARYEHAPIGFPKVILKWGHEWGKGEYLDPYYTENGMIKPWQWEHGERTNIAHEIKRFEDFVRSRYANDATVQG